MIQKMKNLLPRGSFARNVITLMTGTTFSQVLLILVSPILTRLYNPGDFGVYTLYTSILGVVAVVANWRYQLAIVLPEKDEDAANLLALSGLIAFFMSCLLLVGVALFRHQVAVLLGSPELASWLWFLPISILAVGLFQAFNYWSTRREQFKRLAVRQVTQSMVTAASQVGLPGFISSGCGGLIGGHILGQLAATARLGAQIWRDEGRYLLSHINLKNIEKMLVRYRKFPIYDSWSALLNTASAMLPALLLGYFFNPTVVGLYSLGHRALAVPMSVVGGAMAQAFFPRAAEAYRQGSLDKFTLEIFQRLLAFGLVPILLVAIIAPGMFAIVFGSQWYEAGIYARWMCLWLLFQFVSSPISSVINVLEKQRISLFFNLALFSGRTLALIIGGLLQKPLLAIMLLGLVGAVMYFAYSILILFLAKVNFFGAVRSLLSMCAKSIIFLSIPMIGVCLSLPDLLNVCLGVMAGVVFAICYSKGLYVNSS